MSSAVHTNEWGNVSHSSITISVCVSIGIIAIIIAAAVFVRYKEPVFVTPNPELHAERCDERHPKGITGYVLEMIPVVSYDAVRPYDLESASRWPTVEDELSATTEQSNQSHTKTKATATAVPREGKVKNSRAPHRIAKMPFMPHKIFTEESPGSAYDLRDCSICAENFSGSDRLRVLPCGHAFHASCIDPWLLKFASTCPVW